MKALIIFDGSEASRLSLETACQDAYIRQQKNAQSQESFEAVVVAFEFTPQDDQALSWNSEKKRYLEQVGAFLKCKGAFDQIKTRYIQYQGNPTEIVIELANTQGVDSIYLIDNELEKVSPKKPKILERLGLVKPLPVATFSAVKIETLRLLKETSCKIIITDAQGLFMRFSYHNTNPNPVLYRV